MTDLRGPLVETARRARRPRTESPPPQDSEWVAALQRVLDEPQRVRVHFQPIVDLQRGIVRGYEALARFSEIPGAPVVSWFEAAARLGYAGALEAQVVSAALMARPLLVRNRFISVNLSPAVLTHPAVVKALGGAHRLDAIVVELTGRADPSSLLAVRGAVDELRARGALLAAGDAGAPGGVDDVLALRPQFLKLGGSLTRDIAEDPARVDAVEALAHLATRLDAQLVAEGIETDEQLDALAGLGVPLGQGYALARPTPAMVDIDRELVQRLRRRAASDSATAGLGRLLERVPGVPEGPGAVKLAFGAQAHLEHVVLLGAEQQPVGIIDRVAHARGAPVRLPLCVAPDVPVAEIAKRAMARPLVCRWDPVVCVGPTGAYQGVVPVERIVVALAGA